MDEKQNMTRELAAIEAMAIRDEILKLEERLGQLHKSMKQAGMPQVDRFPAFMPIIGEMIPKLYLLVTDLVGSKMASKLRR